MLNITTCLSDSQKHNETKVNEQMIPRIINPLHNIEQSVSTSEIDYSKENSVICAEEKMLIQHNNSFSQRTNPLGSTKSILGPKHKSLGKDFLILAIETLKSSNDAIYNLCYEGEEFYITNIIITDKQRVFEKNRTYKNKWNECDNEKPIPNMDSECPCNLYVSSDEDAEEIIKNILIDDIKHIEILYDGPDVSYFSEPANDNIYAGGQFEWNLLFNYYQPGLNISMTLGPKHYIKVRDFEKIKTHGLSNAYKMEAVYDYEPDNFRKNIITQIDLVRSLNNCLVNNETKFTYDGVKYNLIDYKFCRVDSAQPECGCHLFKCNNMPKQWGIDFMIKKKFYFNHVIISCTPEWYIQVQLEPCNTYEKFCAKFILTPIATDEIILT